MSENLKNVTNGTCEPNTICIVTSGLKQTLENVCDAPDPVTLSSERYF